MSKSLEILLEILNLERIEQNIYRGESPDVGWQRVFGGLVIGQALVAAQRTVDEDRLVHSLHSYFMRPGDPTIPILYQVDRIRDGHSFNTRRVVAVQHGRAIFSMSASFHKPEQGLEHHMPMPDVVGPDELKSEKELAEFAKFAPPGIREYWEQDRPIEFKPTSLQHYITNKKLEPKQEIWFRATGDVPSNIAVQQAVLAYASDMTLLDTALFAHGKAVFDPRLQVASLDHAMWFHRPTNVQNWHLYSQDSPTASGARGFTRGSIYDVDGNLVASVAQEGLIRVKSRGKHNINIAGMKSEKT